MVEQRAYSTNGSGTSGHEVWNGGSNSQGGGTIAAVETSPRLNPPLSPSVATAEIIPGEIRSMKLQEVTSSIIYKTMLFEKFVEDARGELPWLIKKTEDNNTDHGSIHIRSLIEAHTHKDITSDSLADPDQLSWSNEFDNDYIQGRLSRIEKELDPEREQLSNSAERFSSNDYFRAKRNIRKVAKQLPKELRPLLLDFVNVPLENVDPQRLKESQMVTANITYGTAVFKEYVEDAKNQLPYRQRSISENEYFKSQEDIAVQHIAGLLDANKAVHDPEAMKRFRDSWGEDADYYLSRVERIEKQLEVTKEAVYENAQYLEPFDNKLALTNARSYGKQLPRDIMQLLYQHVGTSPEEIRSKLAKMGVTGSAFALSVGAIDGMAATSAFATLGMNNVVDMTTGHSLNDLSTPTLGGIVAATYVYWGWEMSKNFGANYRALEQEGVSTSIISKAFYEYTSSKTDNKQIHKLASNTGYAALEFIKEIPWLTAFLALPTKEAFITYAGANVGAALYERVAKSSTDKILTKRRERYNVNFLVQ